MGQAALSEWNKPSGAAPAIDSDAVPGSMNMSWQMIVMGIVIAAAILIVAKRGGG